MRVILISTSTFGKYDSGLIPLIESKGFEVVLNPYGRKLTEIEAAGFLKEYRPVGMLAGVEPLTSFVFENAQGLKVVSRCGIGLDSVDLVSAKALGILVTNTPDAPTIPVAELTLGMILCLLRQIHVSDAGIKRGEWIRPYGRLLYGKTVGIIGCGRIGSYLAKLLQPFGCNVLGCDPACLKEECFNLVELDDVLRKADIISLHIPYNVNTHHFINTERIMKMKDGAYVVNTSRGGLIDEDALFEALTSGKLTGASIDSFEKEPYSGDLKRLDNMLMTGHIGSYAKEARIMMEREAVDNLLTSLQSVGVSR